MEVKLKTIKVKGIHQKLSKFRACDPLTSVLIWSVNYSVSQLKHIMPRIILLPDDFKAFLKIKVINHLFNEENLPEDFKFKEYCPIVFQKLRETFLINSDKYLESFNREPPHWKFPEKKSESKMLITSDNNFIIKIIAAYEMSEVHRILLDYYEHIISSNTETLLPNYLFMYRITLNDRDSYLIGIKNVFDPLKKIYIKYDLKGFIIGRETDEKEKTKPIPTLKDADFQKIGRKLIMNSKQAFQLIKILESDVKFLQSKKFTNYRLLIGIHKKLSSNHYKISNEDFLSSDEELSQSESIDNMIERFYIESSDKNKEKHYYFGIIGILKKYGMKQKTEQTCKAVKLGKDAEMTSMEPEQYGKRFINFIKNGINIKDS